LADETNQFTCPDCNSKTNALKSYRFLNYPETLMVVMRRFVFEDWVPRKVAVQVSTPEKIDLGVLRAIGPKSTEHMMSENSSTNDAPKQPQMNQKFVEELMGMGFPKNRCERAVFKTNNQGTEVAMGWLLEHMEDIDIDEPIFLAKKETKQINLDPAVIENLVQMGFTNAQAKKALKETNNNPERAVEWLFSHSDDIIIDEDEKPIQQTTQPPQKQNFQIDQNPSLYELSGIIVHLGTSTHSGHYVVYLKKNNEWVLYNDRKVSVSEKPPIGGAYLLIWSKK